MPLSKPFPQSYWVLPGFFCAGQYPGSEKPAEVDTKLNGLLDCGIRRTINLVPKDERSPSGQPFVPYQERLQTLAALRDQAVECLRMDFPDGMTPDRKLMSTILDTVDASIAAGEPIYVHCFGGHGRTGTVVGCYLVRHGMNPDEAIQHILTLRQGLPHDWYPFENNQAAFIRAWSAGK